MAIPVGNFGDWIMETHWRVRGSGTRHVYGRGWNLKVLISEDHGTSYSLVPHTCATVHSPTDSQTTLSCQKPIIRYTVLTVEYKQYDRPKIIDSSLEWMT